MKLPNRLLSLLGLALALPLSTQAATIFSEDFSGVQTTDLNGTTPDTTTGGATWMASPTFGCGARRERVPST